MSASGVERLGALAIAAAGVGSRLAFVSVFPARPFSDFQALIGFGLRLRDAGWAAPSWFWTQFNAGLPMILSLLYRAAPAGGAAPARILTAAATGLLGLLPYFLWRGAARYRVRLAAGLLLALWPGQIAFSGVVAQDNWVLLPAVALGALAARVLLSPSTRAHPAAAGLLYASAAAIRQEMLVVLLPLAVAAALPRQRRLVARNAAILILAAGAPLLALAAQRRAATGRFALTTEHAGLSLLGSFVPGASAAGWIDPRPWVASVEPALLAEDESRLRAAAARLALAEARRRLRFHVLRIGTQTAALAVRGESDNLYWSLLGPGVLPPARQPRAAAFATIARPVLTAELALIQGLFAAAVAVGFLRRSRAILVLSLAAALKIGIHAIASPMSRLLVPATALELLAIGLAAGELPAIGRRARGGLALLAAGLPVALLSAVPPLERRLASADVDAPRTYRFPLVVRGGPERVWCDVDAGRLAGLDERRGTLETFTADPAPGDRARAVCSLPAVPSGRRLVLRFEDAYGAGGRPGRMVQRVAIDGREVLSHDVADEPFAGWLEVPVADGASLPGRRVTFEVMAVRPEPGWSWGAAARSSFEFAMSP
jgi:hypothetical protein